MFDKQQNDNYNRKQPFSSDKLYYNVGKDYYICPMVQQMNYIGDGKRKTSKGFEQTSKRYQAKNCNNCPLNGACHKSQGNRVIEINENLKRNKEIAYMLLNSEKGIEKKKQRCHDVEPVFGNIKQNHGLRRFMLRGKDKVARMGIIGSSTKYQEKSGLINCF